MGEKSSVMMGRILAKTVLRRGQISFEFSAKWGKFFGSIKFFRRYAADGSDLYVRSRGQPLFLDFVKFLFDLRVGWSLNLMFSVTFFVQNCRFVLSVVRSFDEL